MLNFWGKQKISEVISWAFYCENDHVIIIKLYTFNILGLFSSMSVSNIGRGRGVGR